MKKLIMALALPLFAYSAFAGPITSGGGFAVVCRNVKGKIDSAQLLDLYEAEKKLGLTLIESKNDVVKDLKNAVSNQYRILGFDLKDPSTDASIESALGRYKDYLNEALYLPINFKLPEVSDLGLHELPPLGCNIEQVAFFDDSSEKLKISTSIWNELDSLSQAALIFHEVIYLDKRRSNNDITSMKTRSVVGVNFSNAPAVVSPEQIKNLQQGMIKDFSKVESFKEQVQFYHKREGRLLTLNLARLPKRLLQSRTAVSFDIGNIKFKNIHDNNYGRSLLYTDSNVPMILRSHSDSILLDIDMEIIINPGEATKARIFEDGELIYEGLIVNFILGRQDIFIRDNL